MFWVFELLLLNLNDRSSLRRYQGSIRPLMSPLDSAEADEEQIMHDHILLQPAVLGNDSAKPKSEENIFHFQFHSLKGSKQIFTIPPLLYLPTHVMQNLGLWEEP